MTEDIAARLDATLDAIALLRATIHPDFEAIGTILDAADHEAVLTVLVAMVVSHLQDFPVDPVHYLDSYRQYIEARAAAGEPF